MIWDEREAMTRFQQVLELSGKALAEKPKPDLLVWPEAAVPSLFLWDTNLYDGKTIYDWITGLARDQHIWLIMGADDAEPLPNGKVDYYNSSFLIDPSGEVLGKYRKRRLVIFGEYVPFSRWLPILSTLVQSHGEFQPGNQPVAFRLGALNVVTSVLICFEDVFPHLTREYVDPDTDFLLNLTNNGWFGESAAQWQHAASAVFRAVENNLPLVRCANNGLTCWVDRRGRMHNVFYEYSKNIYEAGYKIVDVPVGSTAKYIPTFYRRHGDLFGWGCCGFSLLLVALAQLRIAIDAQTVVVGVFSVGNCIVVRQRHRREEPHRRPEVQEPAAAGMAHQEPGKAARPQVHANAVGLQHFGWALPVHGHQARQDAARS